MFKKLRRWLFPATLEDFKFDAVDKDGDGLVQEGTPFERKLVKAVVNSKKPVKKAVKKKPVKKATTKKPAKKTVTKKPVKKTVKKTTKKK